MLMASTPQQPFPSLFSIVPFFSDTLLDCVDKNRRDVPLVGTKLVGEMLFVAYGCTVSAR